jgi:hypothetical protein
MRAGDILLPDPSCPAMFSVVSPGGRLILHGLRVNGRPIVGLFGARAVQR